LIADHSDLWRGQSL